jgi:hypothetical protein
MQPDLEGAGLLREFGNSSCWYTALMSLGMTLIRANTLAFGLIGKDGPHGIIKICFGNMNLVLEARPRYWDFGNICFEFSLECSTTSCVEGKRHEGGIELIFLNIKNRMPNNEHCQPGGGQF